jgi:hypothetical protein
LKDAGIGRKASSASAPTRGTARTTPMIGKRSTDRRCRDIFIAPGLPIPSEYSGSHGQHRQRRCQPRFAGPSREALGQTASLHARLLRSPQHTGLTFQPYEVCAV